MKNKFWPGFLAGIIGALFISAAAVGIYSITTGNSLILPTQASQSGQSLIQSPQVRKKLNTIQGLINKNYIDDVKIESMSEGLYQGLMFSLGDPYAAYYSKEDFASLMESTNGIYCGIGATVQQDVKTGVITIVKPFKGSPALEAGILPGDIIYKVAGKEVTGLDLTEVVSNMKGEEGTEVVITIVREGEDKPKDFTIERRKIEVPTIEHKMLDKKIGYIAVSEFDKVTSDQFIKAVDDLDKKGQKGLIIDLRNNGGGLYDTAVSMLDRMLPKGLLVYQEDKYGNRDEEHAKDNIKFTKPLVILINGNSASASEIFAGTIQDYGIGKIVGTTSFGKGIVQSVIPLYDDSAVKLTVAKYYTAKGRNIHGTGIIPDVKVELKEELKQKAIITEKEDNQLQKAIQVILKDIK